MGKPQGAGARAPRRQTNPRRARKNVAFGQVHVQATFNNTIVTVTDKSGGAICWASAGGAGFRGNRKSTPFAARIAAQNAYRLAIDNGMQEVDVFVKGPGPGREAAVRALQGSGLRVKSITDVTPVPHNGCRPTKRRRV
ncbi:MAG TPA: 30S ribosomal protein S11 [Thermoflexales bacterium]|nr:30S ribosomal protein S11 [Anaerolineae bacterium]MBP7599897.1 30S ribosomal protein S11 [Thermoflexales bacterium]MBP8240767.1 30S ribosomal protein S11 [Thermoflexales bacterium]HQV28649.1 30S ribosomal protein S11 [Thermoflexales bacterium]HQX11169.1 30S ribosomal protein S11 [Thermoflexales bacterium]